MPSIHTIPVNQAISKEELVGRVSSGWVYIGQMAVQENQGGVLDPSKPQLQNGAMLVHVWLLPEPTVPANSLLRLLQNMYAQYHKGTLNYLARQLWGMTVPEIIAQMSAADQEVSNGQETDENEEGERDGGGSQEERDEGAGQEG